MSDTSEESCKADRTGDGGDNMCRDFARGICDRKFCKYKHENETKPLNFCHDFQNTACPRPNCKFIHCTTDEEEEYKKTGEMSNQILIEATRKCQLPGLQPICNQFRKGMCRRAFCKYRHVTKEEEEAEIIEVLQTNNNNKRKFDPPVVGLIQTTNNNTTPVGTPFNQAKGILQNGGLQFEKFDDCNPPLQKRRFIPPISIELLDNDINRRRPFFKGYVAGNPPILTGLDAHALMLEEENNLLHKEIAQLKKQVSDLTATNEFLLDQNATLRISGKRNGTVPLPAVTITNTIPQNNATQQVIRTVTASVATVPVSIANVSTGTAVSGNPVSIAGCATVSMAPPAQILAPSQQILVTTNPSSQLALANSSQAQLAIAQQNLANNLAAQQAQPQLTSQAQQLALASTTQQLTSQAQHVANQQLVLASAPQQLASQGQQITITGNSQQLAPQSHLTTQAQQLGQQLTSQAQQLANQQLTSQAQQLALANTGQQLTSQAQQLALATTGQQLTSQAQQLALANTPQQLAVAANVSQQLALASNTQQLLAQQAQNLASSQQLEMHRNSQMNAINTSQTMAMSNATQSMMSYPIMTQTMSHTLPH
ncbi:zinc finger CCCH domain-containing protein 10 isoform X2 [Agrilus planipennis]|nr:zinc finger CCCH domain-containing protein 10 isoform X2 [Agrilus planipennis]XP_018318900.1 zinc finger CCCH domain-containing protein 10 isoform X2 [Agrilus planipennis]